MGSFAASSNVALEDILFLQSISKNMALMLKQCEDRL